MKTRLQHFAFQHRNAHSELEKLPTELKIYRDYEQRAFRLHALLEDCERSMCKEPRDKVYGLLGLASNIREGQVIVDCSKPMFKIYEETVEQNFAKMNSSPEELVGD